MSEQPSNVHTNHGGTMDLAALLAEHSLIERSAGNGYTEPQEHWATCECGAFLGAWQQYYHETDYDPERDFRQHLAFVIRRAVIEELITKAETGPTDGTNDPHAAYWLRAELDGEG